MSQTVDSMGSLDWEHVRVSAVSFGDTLMARIAVIHVPARTFLLISNLFSHFGRVAHFHRVACCSHKTSPQVRPFPLVLYVKE